MIIPLSSCPHMTTRFFFQYNALKGLYLTHSQYLQNHCQLHKITFAVKKLVSSCCILLNQRRPDLKFTSARLKLDPTIPHTVTIALSTSYQSLLIVGDQFILTPRSRNSSSFCRRFFIDFAIGEVRREQKLEQNHFNFASTLW